MNEQQTMEQIKTRLSKFLEDIDEWIGLLDQLEEKVKQVSN